MRDKIQIQNRTEVSETDATASHTQNLEQLGKWCLKNIDFGEMFKTLAIMMLLGNTANAGIYDGHHNVEKGKVIASVVLLTVSNLFNIRDTMAQIASDKSLLSGFIKDISAFEHKLNTNILEHMDLHEDKLTEQFVEYSYVTETLKAAGYVGLTTALINGDLVWGGCVAVGATEAFLATKGHLADFTKTLTQRLSNDSLRILNTLDLHLEAAKGAIAEDTMTPSELITFLKTPIRQEQPLVPFLMGEISGMLSTATLGAGASILVAVNCYPNDTRETDSNLSLIGFSSVFIAAKQGVDSLKTLFSAHKHYEKARRMNDDLR